MIQLRKTIITVVMLFSTSLALSSDRVALVIGNGQYQQAELQNATNDADDVARQLRALGFDVTLRKNLNRKSIRGAFRHFSQKVTATTEIALIFYSGHGAQFENQSYLIPIGADIHTDEDLPDEAINARSMLSKVENRRAKVNVMILDACRNLPFNMASSSKSAVRGLAPINKVNNTLIAYATASGQTASDAGDNGRNSPYTEILLKHLPRPNLTLTQMFNDIGVAVKNKYGQVPWVSSSPIPNVYLSKGDQPSQPHQPVVSSRPQSINPVVQPPDNSDIIRKIQVQLNRLQCNAGTTDGIWGNKGRSALAKLVQANPGLGGYSQPNRELLDKIQNMSLQQCPVAVALPSPAVQQTNQQVVPQSAQTNTSSQTGQRIDHYIAYDNGTALDTKTGLLWQRCSYGQRWNGTGCSGEPQAMDWQAAMQLRNNGWRLPTFEELKTIVYCSSGKPKGVYPGRLHYGGCEGSYERPTINTHIFPMQEKQYFFWDEGGYWSSSPYARNDSFADSFAWSVGFSDGNGHSNYKDNSYFVRLVRGL